MVTITDNYFKPEHHIQVSSSTYWSQLRNQVMVRLKIIELIELVELIELIELKHS